jgi:superfamily II DNA or RNA helicase
MSEPPMMTGASAVYEYSEALEKRFEAVSRFGDPFSMSKVVGKHLHLPRAVCPMGLDLRVDGVAIDFTSSFVPRSVEQARVVSEVVACLKAGHSGVLQAPTGFGKTAVFSEVIAQLGIKPLIIVTKDDLQNQWIDAAQKMLGLKPKEIGLIRQDTCQVEGRKFVIGMIHSLSIPGRYPQWILDEFGLVCWDEVHHISAESFSNTAQLFPSKLRWGLSATVDRVDGKEVLIFANIGPIRVKAHDLPMTPRIVQVMTNWMCPRVRKIDEEGRQKVVRLPHSPGKCGHITKIISKDIGRNTRLAAITMACHAKGRRIVVFSDLLEHLDRFKGMLSGLPSKDIGYYVGGMKQSELDKSKACRIILATYHMMSEGSDIPWLDTAVLLTPRSDVRQVVGRILREHPDKQEPLVIDPVDDDSPVYAGYAKRRRHWYRAIGAVVAQAS